ALSPLPISTLRRAAAFRSATTANGRCWRSACRNSSASTSIPRSPAARCRSRWNCSRLRSGRSRRRATWPASGGAHGPMSAPTCAAAIRNMSGRTTRWPRRRPPAPSRARNKAIPAKVCSGFAFGIACIQSARISREPRYSVTTMPLDMPDLGQSRRLRLNTLVRLRWLAIVGQSVTVVIVAYGLGFPLPVVPCFALIACSAVLNVYLALQYPSTHRLRPLAAFGILTFDALQLAGLLYMTGGLTNPFSLLMAVPVVVSATSLPLAMTALLGGGVIAMATLLAVFHLPLPWYDGTELVMPFIYVAGGWVALSSSIAFTGIY